MATSFDTMKAYQSIAAAGVDHQAATAITTALADVATAARADLATKSDLENLRLQLTGDMNTRAAEVRTEIATIGKAIEMAQSNTIKWVVGTGLVVVLAAVTFASHYLVLTTR